MLPKFSEHRNHNEIIIIYLYECGIYGSNTEKRRCASYTEWLGAHIMCYSPNCALCAFRSNGNIIIYYILWSLSLKMNFNLFVQFGKLSFFPSLSLSFSFWLSRTFHYSITSTQWICRKLNICCYCYPCILHAVHTVHQWRYWSHQAIKMIIMNVVKHYFCIKIGMCNV